MLERTVTVSASGSATAPPDVAHINTGVQTKAASAREAMAANTVLMTKLIDGLKAAGLDAKDLHTTSINLSPRYTQPRDGKQPVITGYFAQNQVRITVRDIKKLGELLDTAISLGATQVNGISFDVSAAETLRDEARKAAMVNARRRAELYAAAAGASLGQVITISETAQASGVRLMQSSAMSRSAGASIPVEAGEMQLETNVYVTWSLK